MGLTELHDNIEGYNGYTFKLIPATIHKIDDTDSPYDAELGEYLYVDASVGTVTVNLPEGTAEGHRVKIHVTDHTNGVSIVRGGSDTIVGATQFDVTDINTVDYEFTTIGSGPYDWKFTELAHRSHLESYADQAEADAISSANGYTDSAVSGLATTGYVDTAEADAVASANGYTDTAVTGLATEAYADQAEADAITSANGYTDSAVSGLATTGYVDTAKSDAISSSNGYTDSAVSGLASTTYVDTAVKLPNAFSTADYVHIDETDSPHTAAAGKLVIVDTGLAGNVTINLPTGAEGDCIGVVRIDTNITYSVTVQSGAGTVVPASIPSTDAGYIHMYVNIGGSNYWGSF